MSKRLLVISIFIINCYANIEQFNMSEYNDEQQKMVNVCMDLQVEGKLPGLTSNVDEEMVFRGNVVNLNQIKNISYPLDMKCVINKGSKEHSYLFRKNQKLGKWDLVKAIR